MTDKITLSNLVNLQNETTAVTTINSNNAAIVTAMDNTLSRNGQADNSMLADLDMNSHRILNLPAPVQYTEPLRLLDLSLFVGGTPISITAQPLPVGGLTGNPLVKNSGANYDVTWGTTIRLTGATTFTSGSGLQLGFDGTSGFVQTYNNATATALPQIYDAISHSFRLSGSEKVLIDTALKAKQTLLGPVLGNTVKSVSVSDCVYNPNNPLFMQWGASAGSAVLPSTINGNWKSGYIVSYIDRTGAGVETDTTGFQVDQHVIAGSGSVSGSSFQAYLDNPTSGTNHSCVAQYLGAHTTVPMTGGSSGMWGQTIGVLNNGNNGTQMIGTEYDMQNSAVLSLQKFGIAMLELGTGTVSGTWTPAAGPAISTMKASAAFGIGAGSPSVEPWAYGLLAMQRNNGEGKPVSDAIICGSGFDMVNGFGIHFGNMIWSGAGGPMLIPNNTYIKAFNNTAGATQSLIGYTTGNQILIGNVLTVDPATGALGGGFSLTGAIFTANSFKVNGTAGAGFVELVTQSSAPATGAANTVRLFSNAAGAFAWKGGNGFNTIIASTSNTADRGYTLPDAGGTFNLIDVAQTITGAKTFGAAGNVGKLIVAGTTSGTTILNASATASGTLTLPAATDTLIGKATTDTLTNKTYDTAGTGNSLSIAGVAVTANTGTGAVARATSPVFVTPTLGAATATSVNFGATSLAAYQVGSWTPVDSSGAALTFTSVSANYTRIGNMVFAYGRLTYPTTASGATNSIGGLPFTTSNTTYNPPGTLYSGAGNTNAHSLSVNANATTFFITKTSGGVSLNSDLSTQLLVFCVMYPIT